MNKGVYLSTRAASLALFLVIAVWVVGCRHCVNPYKDELAARRPVTTASVDGVRAAAVEPPAQWTRPHTVMERYPVAGAVTHFPLYFEDPWELPSGADPTFAWSGDDYWHMVYGPSRFLVNVVCFPVSAVVAPPWTIMESRGGKPYRWHEVGSVSGESSGARPSPGASRQPMDRDESGGPEDSRHAANPRQMADLN